MDEAAIHKMPLVSKKKFGLNKSERLCNKTDIDLLLQKGVQYRSFPVNSRYLWKDTEESFFAQILVSVPKRNFKRAVKRNLLKRRIREAYRLNKNILYNCKFPDNKKLLIAFVFSSKELSDFNEIQSKIILTLQYIVTASENKK